MIEELIPDLNAWKLLVPKNFRLEILKESHDLPQVGHLGVEKTVHRIMQLYFWPNLFREVCWTLRDLSTDKRISKCSSGPDVMAVA